MGSLSLCMIVRNEEAMLPDFLASVAGIWDELIAVDTGSQDTTCELLAAAGAHIVHHRWQDDFSAARNASLEKAGGEWILFLDADERCSRALGAEIRSLLDDPNSGAATLVMRNLRPDGTHRDTDLLRLFRNDASIRFKHRIHEDPSQSVRAYLDRTGKQWRRLRGVAHHLGYLKEVAAGHGKRERDMALLKRVLEADPNDLYSWFKLMEQARFWQDEATWRQAARNCRPRFEKAAAEGLAAQPWADEWTALLAQGLHAEPREGLAWLDALPSRLLEGPAVQLRRGLWLETAENLAEAEQAFLACRERAGQSGSDTLYPLRSGLGLCRIKAATGNLYEAWLQAVEACRACPTDPEALLAAVGFAPSAMARADWLTNHLVHYPQAAEAVARTLRACGVNDLAAAITDQLGVKTPIR